MLFQTRKNYFGWHFILMNLPNLWFKNFRISAVLHSVSYWVAGAETIGTTFLRSGQFRAETPCFQNCSIYAQSFWDMSGLSNGFKWLCKWQLYLKNLEIYFQSYNLFYITLVLVVQYGKRVQLSRENIFFAITIQFLTATFESW